NEGGCSIRAAAERFNVSPATAHRWWHRWCEAGEEARRALSCLFDRSSRPGRSPRQLAPQLEEAICACRRETGWGPRLVAGATGFAHSTVSKVLRRAGISRPPRPGKEPANRYEWPCPGDLLHMDTSRYARFLRPGHKVTGDRSQRHRNWMRSETRVGYDYAHAIVDDHSRLAYVELHPDEKAATVTGFLERALAFFAQHEIVARRLMTDNGFSDVKNRSLRELLAAHRVRHLTTEPYRPRTNGKVERFHQTMGREWAYGLAYRSHRTATRRCHTGSTTTTGHGHTARSETGPRSAAFTTSVGRTISYRSRAPRCTRRRSRWPSRGYPGRPRP
ncbi:MAG: DDE-type integrase/transposase/recombinase, partial [Actinobacteria bacterium]|nr:DDE-type integrase/transposase/recombinase [Actinomycetota bacterium]